MTKGAITVVVADDHPIFRKGLREILTAEPDVSVVAEVADGEAALDALRSLAPRVAVLDVDMPRRDGLQVARAAFDEGLNVAIVLLTMHREERLFNAALDVGIQGYVLKDSAITEVAQAIRAVAAGQRWVTPLLTDFLLERGRTASSKTTALGSLTDAERRVLRLVAEYRTSREIADELFISARTVDRHRANIAAKLELRGAHALLQYAVQHKTEL